MTSVTTRWSSVGHLLWRAPSYISLAAKGPAKSGVRSVLTLYPNGQVAVPFGAYAGQNTGIPIPALSGNDFRKQANQVFGFSRSRTMERTKPGWLDPARADAVIDFAMKVADVYVAELAALK